MGILLWLCGFVIGIVVSSFFRNKTSFGVVEIDTSDPECPYMRLRMTDYTYLDKMIKRKSVTLKVDNTADFTRGKQML